MNTKSPTKNIGSLDKVSEAIFELIWGPDRPPILTTVDQAYEHIWRKLIGLSSRQSQRLSDVTLAAELRISPTPVRQALERLAQQGLVQFDPRRGYWTNVFTVQDVEEIYDLREVNEILALRLALPNLSAEDLNRQLEHLYNVRNNSSELDISLFLESDFRLHNLFIRASGNQRLIRYLATLRSQQALFQVRDTSYPRRIEIALDDHEKFIRALLRKDTSLATGLLSEHIQHAKQGVLADMFPENLPPE